MYRNFLKRLFDFILAITALPFLLIILIIVGPIIYFQDKGSIFYNAPRLGKDGRIFKMYKFRSMKMNVPDLRNEDGSTFNSKDDPRLMKIGKFIRKTSIDEIPQILNVLKGDMSFIGPRPDLPDHYLMYTEEEKQKLDVLPGISGYNQIYYRNAAVWKDRLKNDVYYVNNMSFILDLKIFFRTILIIVLRKGVYSGRTVRKSSTEDTRYATTEHI